MYFLLIGILIANIGMAMVDIWFLYNVFSVP